jgi:fluoroquinolone transport system ATP-binding protein
MTDQVIEVSGLNYTYAGRDVPAVKGIDFSIARGEIFGFLGPNGAGKSTTQNILTGLLPGYDGHAMVWGREMSSWGGDYYERIGVCFERPNLYRKLTARENLEFFGSLYSGPVGNTGELLEQVGMGAEADLRVGQLSKGMQVRLSFARSLLNSPELLFLDEPTAGLDPAGAVRIREIIEQQRRRGATIFLTTHDMVTADALCDRVAFLLDGRIILTEPPRELKIRHGRRTVTLEYRGGRGTESRVFPLQDLGSNREFLDLLRRETIETIHTQEATLADVFIQVTGRRLS